MSALMKLIFATYAAYYLNHISVLSITYNVRSLNDRAELLVVYHTISLCIGIIGTTISHLRGRSDTVRMMWIGHLIIATIGYML